MLRLSQSEKKQKNQVNSLDSNMRGAQAVDESFIRWDSEKFTTENIYVLVGILYNWWATLIVIFIRAVWEDKYPQWI